MRPRRGWACVGVVVASLCASACGDDYRYCSHSTAAFLVNATREDLPMEVHRVRQPLDCMAVEQDPLGQLQPGSFESKQDWLVPPMEKLWLDRQIPVSTRPRSQVCDAVLLRAAGMPDTILFWRESIRREVLDGFVMESAPEPNGVYIERVGENLVLTGDAVHVFSVE